jgi:regulator of protease activity HflC (stomatin/prohibitin superfamily)
MELQMAAERKKRAAILKSEGERTTMINEAEGRAKAATTDAEARGKSIVFEAQAEAERQRVEAEGLKIAIQTVAQAIRSSSGKANGDEKESVEAAVQFLSVIRYMETQAKFAASNGTKVLMFPTKDR